MTLKNESVILDNRRNTGGKNLNVVLSTQLTVSTKKEQRSKKERNCGYDYILYIKTKAVDFILTQPLKWS
jgi:hypothetical protein